MKALILDKRDRWEASSWRWVLVDIWMRMWLRKQLSKDVSFPSENKWSYLLEREDDTEGRILVIWKFYRCHWNDGFIHSGRLGGLWMKHFHHLCDNDRNFFKNAFYQLPGLLHESKKVKVMSDSLWSHGLYSICDSPGQNTGMGSLCFLQQIFLT